MTPELPPAPALRHNRADGRWYIILEWATPTQAKHKVDVTGLMAQLREAAQPKDYRILQEIKTLAHQASCHNWSTTKTVPLAAALEDWIKQYEKNNAGAEPSRGGDQGDDRQGSQEPPDYGPFADA